MNKRERLKEERELEDEELILRWSPGYHKLSQTIVIRKPATAET